MENNNIEFNYSACIKEQHNIGETVYYNICNNEVHSVKWGSFGWCGFISLSLVIIIVILLIIGLINTIRY
jgi:hypothetical protein